MLVNVDAILATLSRCEAEPHEEGAAPDGEPGGPAEFALARRLVERCVEGVRVAADAVAGIVFRGMQAQGLFAPLFRPGGGAAAGGRVRMPSSAGDGLAPGAMQTLLDHTAIALHTAQTELTSFACEEVIRASAQELACRYVEALGREAERRNFWNRLKLSSEDVSHLKMDVASEAFAEQLQLRLTSGGRSASTFGLGIGRSPGTLAQRRSILGDWDMAAEQLVELCLEAADEDPGPDGARLVGSEGAGSGRGEIRSSGGGEDGRGEGATRARRVSVRRPAPKAVLGRLRRIIVPSLALFHDLVSFLAAPPEAFADVVGAVMDRNAARARSVARLAALCLKLRADLSKDSRREMLQIAESIAAHRAGRSPSAGDAAGPDCYRWLFR
jgi:hypothetical protein